MTEFDKVLGNIKKKREETPLWIPLTHSGLSKQVGIGRRLYHLFGGDPGTGKTSFVDQSYILDAYQYAYYNPDKVRLKTIYFSMERSKEYKKAKWLANRLYAKNNIIIDVPTLLSWGTGSNLSDEVLEKAEEHRDFFNKLYQDVEIFDGIRNPTGIYKLYVNMALQHGTIYGRNPDGKYYKIDYEGFNKTNTLKKKEIPSSECPIRLEKRHREYVPFDDKLILQLILDHIGKPRKEEGLFTKKDVVDKTSEYLQIARDVYGMGVVAISQFNRNNANIQRRVNTDLTPEQQDFKNTGNTFEDSDVAMALFNPYKHNLNTYKGYIINKTKVKEHSRFRSISLLKNSYGVDNLISGFKFVGECGHFEQLPKPNKINYEQYFDE